MVLAGLLAATLSSAQLLAPTARTVAPARDDCGSVVVQRCDRPVATKGPQPPAAVEAESSRSAPQGDAQLLEPVVIEGRAVTTPGLRELLEAAAPPRPLEMTSQSYGDGARCSCFAQCWVFNCCVCSRGGADGSGRLRY